MRKERSNINLSEQKLFEEISLFIENSKHEAIKRVNNTLVLLFWKIGNHINKYILQGNRAGYGEKIVVTLSRQLTWSHFLVLIPLKKQEVINYYAQKSFSDNWSVRTLRKQISLKSFERATIANMQLPQKIPETYNQFKDPYLLDFLDVDNGYLEQDLEKAILKDLEKFILELGKGFAFVARQKRIIIDGDDYYIDLLFFHRQLKRLIAIELKIDKFKAKYKGQMELYLKWLDKYARQEGEKHPVGLRLQ